MCGTCKIVNFSWLLFAALMIGQNLLTKKNTLSKWSLNIFYRDYQTILNPIGWLNCDIIQEAQVLLHEVNPSIKGFQRPTLGPV